jgi:hypothetical protein
MGQTENTGHCEGLMHKNGEQYVDNYVWRVISFCYAGSRQLLLRRKSSAVATQEVISFSIT